MKIHPFADIFPLMSDTEFDDLCADISINGQLQPIVTMGSQILDGRNRYNACKKLGIVPQYKEYYGKDVLAFVISANLIRRHLNESQRAMVAANLENTKHGGSRQKQDATLHVTRANAAEIMNVSPRLIADAQKINKQGSAEIKREVMSGNLPVSRAVKSLSDKPKTLKRTKNEIALDIILALDTIAVGYKQDGEIECHHGLPTANGEAMDKMTQAIEEIL